MSTIPPEKKARARAGFTLIEVLVALAIAAMGLGFLMAATGTGLNNATIADEYIQASERAQSRLAQVGATLPLRRGVYSGDDGGGFRWRVQIDPPLSRVGSGPALGLYPVRVTVGWRSGLQQKAVTLYSEKVGAP